MIAHQFAISVSTAFTMNLKTMEFYAVANQSNARLEDRNSKIMVGFGTATIFIVFE